MSNITLYGSGSNVKDLVVLNLLSNPSLSTKMLHERIGKGRRVSYQGIHKALRELLGESVVSRTLKGKYSVNVDWVVKVKNAGSIYELYEKKVSEKNLFSGGKLPKIKDRFKFFENEIIVGDIPSVFISKSTFKELIGLLNKQSLNKLRDSIAVKNFIRLDKKVSEGKLTGMTEVLNDFNRVVQDFYWGLITFSVSKDEKRIDLKINSTIFTAKKEKQFYDKIYEQFLNEFNYKLKKYDPLTSFYVFEKVTK